MWIAPLAYGGAAGVAERRGGPVVQHEARAAARDVAQLRVGAALLPPPDRRRLTPGEIGLHRKIRLREVEGVLILGHVFHIQAFRIRRASAASRCICAVSSSRPAKRASSRSFATNSTSISRPYRSPAKSNTCASSSACVPATVGRVPRLATPASAQSATPCTRTANIPATGARRRSSGRLAVGKPRTVPRRSPALTRARRD